MTLLPGSFLFSVTFSLLRYRVNHAIVVWRLIRLMRVFMVVFRVGSRRILQTKRILPFRVPPHNRLREDLIKQYRHVMYCGAFRETPCYKSHGKYIEDSSLLTCEENHYCPIVSRIDSTGYRGHLCRNRHHAVKMPLKRAFSRKGPRSESVELCRGSG